jgi:predicted RNA-binding Zn-ribbon protein involved in translation (DUF1610 family)
MPNQFLPSQRKINHYCPLCGNQFVDGEVDILRAREGQLMVYVTCGNCGVGLIARLSVVPQGLIGLGILTDMSRDEVSEIRQPKPVSAEEVLDMKILTDKGFLEIRV